MPTTLQLQGIGWVPKHQRHYLLEIHLHVSRRWHDVRIATDVAGTRTCQSDRLASTTIPTMLAIPILAEPRASLSLETSMSTLSSCLTTLTT